MRCDNCPLSDPEDVCPAAESAFGMEHKDGVLGCRHPRNWVEKRDREYIEQFEIMMSGRCAYKSEDGICQNEPAATQNKGQAACRGRCRFYARESDVRRRHDAAACDRELTDITADLVKRWRGEGLTVLQIAMLLDRSTASIEKILEGEENGKSNEQQGTHTEYELKGIGRVFSADGRHMP